MSLRSDVTDYYFSRLSELPADKQFHFGNRLAAWNGEPRGQKILKSQEQELAPQDVAELEKLFRDLAAFKPPPTIPGYDLRRPYFDKFPRLTGIHHSIIRLRHLRSIYGIDARETFAKVVPTEELRQLERDLAQDPEAMRILSTYAINTLYLFHLTILEDDEIDVQAQYNLGQAGYQLSDPEQLRLLIYLYTHCVIAASNFYIQELPVESLPIYQQMMTFLEEHIDNNFYNVSLDTKVEFWVCCRVANYDTRLAGRIDAECAASLSPEGTFIIDTHNSFSQLQNKRSFEDSEHRNTLFILSGSPFTPHRTMV